MATPSGDDRSTRFPTLQQRDAGAAPDRTLYEGIPEHLTRPLEDWLRKALSHKDNVARTVLLRCRLDVTAWGASYTEALMRVIMSGTFEGYGSLDLLNAFINLHDDWPSTGPRNPFHTGTEDQRERQWWQQLVELQQLLIDSGSAWSVDPGFRGLYRRVDPTVVEARKAAEKAAHDASRPTATEHLRAAWQETYGVQPDPDEAYEQAIKAIEAAAAPTVAPKDREPTLGKILADMRAQNTWQLMLVDKKDQPWPAETFIDLLDQLWKGHRSRHGGGSTSRPQTQPEAESAVHLAALAVQWFSTGAIKKATT